MVIPEMFQSIKPLWFLYEIVFYNFWKNYDVRIFLQAFGFGIKAVSTISGKIEFYLI